jgi:hypothetical protein
VASFCLAALGCKGGARAGCAGADGPRPAAGIFELPSALRPDAVALEAAEGALGFEDINGGWAATCNSPN